MTCKTKIINAWLDSGANIESEYSVKFAVNAAHWDGMTYEQKEEYAKTWAWQNMDWGFEEVSE